MPKPKKKKTTIQNIVLNKANHVNKRHYLHYLLLTSTAPWNAASCSRCTPRKTGC